MWIRVSSIDRVQLDDWAHDVAGFAPPGGESARDVVVRMDAWARAALVATTAHSARGVHIAVTHAGPIRLHTATALRLPTAACLSWALGFGAACELHFSGDGHARLVRWNA